MQGIEINILRNLFGLAPNLNSRRKGSFAHIRLLFAIARGCILWQTGFFRKVFIYICICYIALRCDTMAKDEEEDDEEEEDDDEE